jgi:hypothetical protein
MPAFSYQRILVTFAALENHIGFYPTPSAVSAFASALTKIRDGQRFDPVSAGETAASTSQDYGVPGSRECRAGQEMENVMHAYHRAAVVGKNGGVKSPL